MTREEFSLKRLGPGIVLALGMVWGTPGVLLGLAKAEEPAAAPVPDRDQAKRVKVQLGIDVLAAGGLAPLAGLRIGLLVNDASRDGSGRRTVQVLASAQGVQLVALFSPEHGLGADRDGKIASGRDSETGLPIHSLYGAQRRPADNMLAGLDAVVVDLQDVGVRFYTYATTMGYLMEVAARRRLKVFVLDRPNPIGAAGVRGPMLDPDLRSFTGYFPMPLQHGMTLGELATMFNGELQTGADLTVIAMQGYRRDSWFDGTGLPWVNPSPNLRTVSAAVVYPGVALIEGTNVSVGRGTPVPFELVGAPWIDGPALAAYLERRGIAGVRFEPAVFTPNSDRYAGKRCQGIRIVLLDREALDAPRLGMELAVALHRLHPKMFAVKDMLALLGSRPTLAAIEADKDPAVIAQRWQAGVEAFAAMRAKYLLY
ncbi:MAG TPA: DUF1343 domain-containing protein [Hyphomicrobiaceae bacterium]|nr:DUF1343 domain-containing protein [Hyphomicrobiaceae bacterium]